MHVVTTDDELLTSADPEDFGLFYARHLRGVETYFARRVGRDAAAELASETFASALVARRRFVPGGTPAAGWLYAIAARRLVDFRRRRIVEQGTRERLASEVAALRDAAEMPLITAPGLERTLRLLPREQQRAIVAHVLYDREYRQIANEEGISEASVRQRVSRGLSGLRASLRVYRAAEEITGESRAYRFGGGHRKPLSLLEPREALDCSSSASLILLRAGLFETGPAWTSSRFAEDWGQPGEGRCVTVWANEEHVWLEFTLDTDHRERFDPTPLRSRPHSGWLQRKSGPKRDFVARHWPGI